MWGEKMGDKRMVNIWKIIKRAFEFCELNGLTLNEMDALFDCYKELERSVSHTTCTFYSKVAIVFKNFGFNVEMDDDGVNYLISM